MEKKVLYAALGAPSTEEAKSILTDSGLTFAQSTEELAAMSRHLPHLKAIGQREELDPEFIAWRGDLLLRLVYARIKDWLGLEWPEDSSFDVISHIEEVPEPDEDGDFVGDKLGT